MHMTPGEAAKADVRACLGPTGLTSAELAALEAGGWPEPDDGGPLTCDDAVSLPDKPLTCSDADGGRGFPATEGRPAPGEGAGSRTLPPAGGHPSGARVSLWGYAAPSRDLGRG